MKRAPTPETDEQHKAMPMGGFTLDFVGELENERDEAIRSCHIWQKGHAELVKERDKWAGLYDAAIAERDELRRTNEGLQLTFDLRWKADQRAIKRWQDATGKKLTWPDHADLVVWILENYYNKSNQPMTDTP